MGVICGCLSPHPIEANKQIACQASCSCQGCFESLAAGFDLSRLPFLSIPLTLHRATAARHKSQFAWRRPESTSKDRERHGYMLFIALQYVLIDEMWSSFLNGELKVHAGFASDEMRRSDGDHRSTETWAPVHHDLITSSMSEIN